MDLSRLGWESLSAPRLGAVVGFRLRTVWIQVRGFPLVLWYFHDFVRLFEPYGQVLALDPATANHEDFRVARVKVRVYDAQVSRTTSKMAL